MKKQSSKRRLSFLAEWYQEKTGTMRSFVIYFSPQHATIKVYDKRNRRTFLRRTKMPELSIRDFYVNSEIEISGRQFKIVGYVNAATRNTMEKYRKRTFLLVKYAIREHLGFILNALTKSNFSIDKALMVQFTTEQAKAFLNKKTNVMKSAFSAELLAGPATGFELIGDNATERIKACREGSKSCNSDTLSEVLMKFFSNEALKAGVYSSDNEEEAAQDLEFFFGNKSGLKPSLTLQNSTLAIIKPHCVKEGKLGDIISDINNHGFQITGLRMTLMKRDKCEELFEIFDGILPEYSAMVAQLASGVCVALEIVCEDDEQITHNEFREFCGPFDPTTAKFIYPNTLRAKFGNNKVLNAIYCTDLPDDIDLDLIYFFIDRN